jgi:hypothetical protein
MARPPEPRLVALGDGLGLGGAFGDDRLCLLLLCVVARVGGVSNVEKKTVSQSPSAAALIISIESFAIA